MITCSCYFDFFSFCFHHVDLKGEFNDVGTVPQENILSPRLSFFAFFHNVIHFFTVVRLLLSQVRSTIKPWRHEAQKVSKRIFALR